MTIGKQDFLQSAGLEIQTLELWVEQRWLLPTETPAGPSFSDRDVARARFIADLREALGVNDAGIDVILHLVDQLHGMRHAFAQVRDGMSEPAP